MKRGKSKSLLPWFCLLFFVSLLWNLHTPEPAYGAAKINKVNITFEAETFDTEGEPVIDAFVKSDRYTVNELDTAWSYYGEDQGYGDGDNTYVVELSAAEGYYFNISTSKGIHLNGAGAELMKASRRDNGQTLIITARLTRTGEFLADISGASWLNDGYASWEAAHGAHLYKVVLVNQKGRRYRAQTGGTRYDFRPFLLESGTYDYQVQPVTASGRAGSWCDGGTYTVSEEAAESYASQFKVEVEYHYKNDIKTPANCTTSYLNTGWQNEGGRFWYRNEDGSYPQSIWMQEGEEWYYFHSDGYLAQDEYISWAGEEYYVAADGKLAADTVTPDGIITDADGKIS